MIANGSSLTGDPDDGLLARQEELAALRGLLAAAHDGSSGVLLLRGEPGVGKTVLLQSAVRQAADMTVLRATGVEMEAERAFAGLVELTRPVLPLVDRLPAVQAAALRRALAWAPGAAPDRLTVGAATLSLLAEAAEQAPVLVTVDDAHYLDVASGQALLFALRRLQSECIAVVIAVRDDRPSLFDDARLPSLCLSGLDRQVTTELLRRVLGTAVDAVTVERLHRQTGGNPLALMEATHAGYQSGEVAWEAPLPVGPRLAAAFRYRLDGLPAPTQEALTVAAASYCDEAAVIGAGLRLLGLHLETLTAAEAAGVLELSAAAVRFRHPLLRATAYHQASGTERRRAHGVLAAALTTWDDISQRDQRAWHLAAAAIGPDPVAANALAETADRAQRQGDLSAASRAYQRAAEVSATPLDRDHHLLAAANMAYLAGHTDRALGLVQAVLSSTRDPGLRAEAAALRGQVMLVRWPSLQVHGSLVRAAADVQVTDPARASALLASAAAAACLGGAYPLGRSTAERACALAADVGGDPERIATAVHAVTLALRGEVAEARRLLANCQPLLTTTDPLTVGTEVLGFAGLGYLWLEDYDAALALLSDATTRVRWAAAVERLPPLLSVLGELHLRTGAWTDAYTCAAEAADLGDELEHTVTQAYPLGTLARIEAAQGRTEACRAHVDRLRQVLRSDGADVVAAYADLALGLLELGTGEETSAAARLADLSARLADMGLRNPNDFQHHPDLVEAYLRSGDRPGAEAAYTELCEQLHRAPSHWGRAMAARCAGLLCDSDDTLDAFAEALRHHDRVPNPFARARTELAYGEELRRRKKRGPARQQLTAALGTFDRLSAQPWACRAEAELQAAGGTPRRHGGRPVELTAQELQVASKVAAGQTNREVAAALFLSVKTVEYHLSHVYAKLGVRSRVELARRPATPPTPHPAA